MRSPQVRTHSFTAQPPDIRRFALITRASRFLARPPCLAAPRIRFLFIGSQLTFHASFPHSVALVQLRFTSFAVINLWRDLHPQECAHAGRTRKRGLLAAPVALLANLQNSVTLAILKNRLLILREVGFGLDQLQDILKIGNRDHGQPIALLHFLYRRTR